MDYIKKNFSEYIPIGLVWVYITLFFFTGLQTYADNYYTVVVFVDTFLFTLSILYYFAEGNRWGFTAKKSLLTAISLNVLTELSFVIDIPGYFWYYSVIICIYLASLTVKWYTYSKTKNK